MGDETGRESARLEAMVIDLVAEVRRLGAEVDRLKGEPNGDALHAPPAAVDAGEDAADGTHTGPLSRRAVLLGGAGAAAAGAVALVASAEPAAAVNGNLVLGTGNSSNAPTSVGASGGTFGLGILDFTMNANLSNDLPTLLGHSIGTTYRTAVMGLDQRSSDTTGVGVNGKSLKGAGVKGSGGVVGVEGTSSFGNGISGISSVGTAILANSDSGLAIDAISQSGHAIRGQSMGIHSGVLGISTSTGVTSDAAVLGVGVRGGGVHGRATTGFGVLGTSDSVAGVRGTVASAAPAVEGVNTKTTAGAGPGVSGTSQNGPGVLGVATASAQPAVQGTHISGFGVKGSSQGSTGVRAESNTGHGLEATSVDGNAVNATSTNGIALLALGLGNTAAVVAGDHAQLVLTPASGSGRTAPTTDGFAHAVGEQFVDGSGDLWYCAAAGTPGTWRKLGGTATSGALHVLPAPTRVYDSRPFTSPSGGSKTPLAANTARSLDLKNASSGVPADALGVLVNVLLLNATAGSGNFTIWANGVPRPSGNTMVWGGSDGRFSTFALTAVDATGTCQVFASLKTDLALDVVGYYR